MEDAIKRLNTTLLMQRSSHVSLPTFKGEADDCVNEFLTMYEYSASVNGWNDEKKAQHLYMALEGYAKKWFVLQLPLADKYTWTDWQVQLRAAFWTVHFQEIAYIRLNERVQVLDESPEHFYYDVLRLCAKVDPLMSESDKVRHLLRAVRPELLPSIMILSPKTAEEVLRSLQQLARTRIMMKSNASTSPDTAYHLPFADLATPTPTAIMTDRPINPAVSRDTVTVRKELLQELVKMLRPSEEANPVTPVPPIPEIDFCAKSATHALEENTEALMKAAQEMDDRLTRLPQKEEQPPRNYHPRPHTAYLGMTVSSYHKRRIARSVSGTVQWFSVKKRYGFIKRQDTKEDVFVHQTAVAKNNPKKAVKSLAIGETVQFDVVVERKGAKAINVTGPGGVPVRGSPHVRNNWVSAPRRFLPEKPRKQVEQQQKKFFEGDRHQTGYMCHHEQRVDRSNTLNNIGERKISANIRSKESDGEIMQKIAELCRVKNQQKNKMYNKSECTPKKPQYSVAPEERIASAPKPERQASHLPTELPCQSQTPAEQPEVKPKEQPEHRVRRYQQVTNFFKHVFLASITPSKIRTI